MKKIISIGSFHFFIKKWKDLSHKYKYKHSYLFPRNTYSPWLDDPEFLELYYFVKEKFTLVDIYRCFSLWSIAKQVNRLQGSLIEVGVWRGGTGLILAKAINSDTLYLCDTFEGVVKASTKDNQYRGGEHNDTTVEIVKKLMNKFGVDNYQIIKGIFPNENSELIENLSFKLCHIDVDVYQSAKDIFEWIWPRLTVGGVIIFDDYGFAACEGITQFVNEEITNRNDLITIYNINGQSIIIKIK